MPAEYKLLGNINDNVNLSLEKHLSASVDGVKPLYKDTEYKFLSDVQVADFPFTGLGMTWDQKTPEGTHVDWEVRFFDGLEWGTFNDISVEMIEDEAYAIITTNPAESFQYRVSLSSDSNMVSPEVRNIEFTYINANDDPIVKAIPKFKPTSSKPGTRSINVQKGNIIGRTNWGANEDLRVYKDDNPEPVLVSLPSDFYIRYAKEMKLKKVVETNEKGQLLTWPLQYPEEVSKVIIHHTATTKDLDNPTKAIRDIYYYHAVAKGWGDIGYNYIIDTNGIVYEGRFGGDSVVGAHAGPGNRGSIGIAVLGNFNEGQISTKAKQSLENLISEKSKLYGIDPKGNSYFRGVKQQNIMGHDDIMNTSCPGENLDKLLPSIRNNVAKLNGSKIYKEPKKSNAEFAFEYLPTLDEIKMLPEKKMTYTVKLKNTGKKTWTANTRLMFKTNKIVENGLFVGDSKMEQSLVKPGQTATFKIPITSKMEGGFYYIPLQPIFNGKTKIEEQVNIPTIVEHPNLAYEFKYLQLSNTNVRPGQKLIAQVVLKNIGNTSWKNYGENRISLGSADPKDRVSQFTKSTRMGYLQESVVAPGEEAHFVFNLTAPEKSGKYNEYFAPVVERVAWLDGKKMKLTINVKS
ncbi:N-acetylmuramoyl-L-alanine amidase [Patescibacteria group bacterium]